MAGWLVGGVEDAWMRRLSLWSSRRHQLRSLGRLGHNLETETWSRQDGGFGHHGHYGATPKLSPVEGLSRSNDGLECLPGCLFASPRGVGSESHSRSVQQGVCVTVRVQSCSLSLALPGVSLSCRLSVLPLCLSVFPACLASTLRYGYHVWVAASEPQAEWLHGWIALGAKG